MDNKIIVGGQAVIEGVMMRGPKAIATAVRRKDGTIVYRKKELTAKSNRWVKTPFARGVVRLFDALRMHPGGLLFSSILVGVEEETLFD